MILLVDIGNTRIKWAFATNSTLRPGGGHSVSHDIQPLLDQLWRSLSPAKQVVLANGLGEQVEADFQAWVAAHWQSDVICLRTQAQAHGVTNAYARPADLGIDRWLGLIAAHRLLASAACIISCGTAITVDAIEASGRHLGGCILPGVAMMQSMLNRAAAIKVEPAMVEDLQAVNASTNAAVRYGSMYAAVSAIDAIVADMKAVLSAPVNCIITGGDAKAIAPLLKTACQYDSDWLFKGMLIAVSETV